MHSSMYVCLLSMQLFRMNQDEILFSMLQNTFFVIYKNKVKYEITDCMNEIFFIVSQDD